MYLDISNIGQIRHTHDNNMTMHYTDKLYLHTLLNEWYKLR